VLDKTLPGSLKSSPLLDAWIRIAPDGAVTVCSGKVELGTGVRTALMQIAAEALEIAPEQLHFIAGDTAVTPNEGYTAGSHTIPDSGTALLHASSQVAALIAAGAATQWGLPRQQVRLVRGRVVAVDGRSMHYGEAVKSAALHRAATPRSLLKDPATFGVIGKAVARVDIPAKVTGGASYVQDMRPTGMLHARVVRPPQKGATLIAADLTADIAAVARLPGVIKVHRDGNYLAVIADDEWRAIAAMHALAASARWQAGPVLPAQATIHEHILGLPMQDIVIQDQGKLPPATDPARTVHARFTKPFVLHGSIGPSCAVGLFQDGALTIWTHTQGVFPLRAALAELSGLPQEQVRCIHTEGSGCYGQNGADDVAADAAIIARALPGRHVRVQLMRDQENLWEPYAPAMVTEITASVDAGGKIDSWQYALWSGSHNERPGNAGKLVPTWFLEKPFTPSPSQPMAQPEGGGDRNAIALYTLPNARVVNHFAPVYPLRTSAMRSLGAHVNILSIESTMDELAAIAGIDPVQFRLNHLDDPRAAAVIRMAAAKFGWPAQRPARHHGVGFAFGKYKNLMGYVAIALELKVDPDTGAVDVLRVVAAADCGQVVNPDGARNQLEGGIVQSTSWTLYEQLDFAADGVRSADWTQYPILRFSQMPKAVEVHLIDQPGAPFLGVAEAAQGPMAGALANALFHATGKRQRRLPLAGAQLKDAAPVAG
jgi:CO/xanthine dehydrogenase Mo-binding subunit